MERTDFMRCHTTRSGRFGVAVRMALFALLLGLCLGVHAQASLDLGSVGPGGQLVYERAIQLYVMGTGPFQVDALPPTHFTDIEDPSRSIPAHVLEWRVTGSDSGWVPMRPGLPTTVWNEEGIGSGAHVIEIDYRVSPTWEHLASAGGYALDVPYRVIGQATLFASTVWPNPAPYGGRVTVACVRQQGVDETLRFVVMDGSGKVLGEQARPVTAERAEVDFTWEVAAPPGTWWFKLEGSTSGLCAAGRLHVAGDARVTPQAMPHRPGSSEAAPSVTLDASFAPPAGIGQWTTLQLRLVGTGAAGVSDARVVVQLPRGLHPIGQHEDELYIPYLAAGSEWSRTIQLVVGPEAKPSFARVGLYATDSSTGAPVEMWTEVPFIPSEDSWLQPEVTLYGRIGPLAAQVEIDGRVADLAPDGTYRAEVSQGWHTVWAVDAMGQRLAPKIVGVRGGAPLGYDLTATYRTLPVTSEARGVLSLTADSSGVHPSFDGATNVRVQGFALSTWLDQIGTAEGRTRWQLTAPELSDSPGFGRLNGALLGEGATLSGLRLGWQTGGEGKVGALRFTYDTDKDAGAKAQWSWQAQSSAGGVGVRHVMENAQESIRVAVWRNASHGAPAFRIEHETSEPGTVRLGTGHSFSLPWGQVGVSTLWSLAPREGTTATHLNLGWQGNESEGLRPFAGLTFDPSGWRTQVGLSLRERISETTLLVGYGLPHSTLYVDWITRRHDPSTESRVVLDVSSGAARGRATVARASVGRLHLEADVELQMAGDSTGVAAVIRLDDTWYGAQWSTKASRSSQMSQVDHRVDGRTQLTLGSRHAALGLLMGVRNVSGSARGDTISTRTGFAGGWGEVEVFPRRWAGVAAAKWNSASGVEYDVYVRYEATPYLWLQLGYHQAPGMFTVFPDHGRGAYARLMWAGNTGW